MRRWTIVLSVVALMLGLIAPAGGAEAPGGSDVGINVEESPTGSYIVVMAADPLIASFEQPDLDSRPAKNAERGLKNGHKKALEDAGLDADSIVNEYTVALNGFSAVLDYEEAKAIARQDGVSMVLPDEMYHPTTENSPTFLGLDDPAGAWARGFDGEDVIIGVIDTGIWPEHPSFADDGSYSDLGVELDSTERSSCDFGNTAHNENDVLVECNNKLLGARQMMTTYRALIGAEDFEYDSARDDDGHGTHTASTAGGNAGVEASIYGIPRGVVSGIAPRARIIAYKGLGHGGGFGSDLAAAIDQAVEDGVDVINYSIGSPSYAIGPDDIAFLFAANAGVFVATSNGNSGPGAATTGSPASVPWLTSVGASTQDRTFQGSASSSDGWEFLGASVTAGTDELPLVDSEDVGNELCLPGIWVAEELSGKVVLCRRGAIARVDKSRAVFEAGGAGMILYNPSDAQSLVTDNHWVPSVHINFTDASAIKTYIDSAGEDAVAMINGGTSTPADAPWMADFSSRGPNRLSADIIKPDVTAPGVNILAGASPTPYLGQDEQGVPGQLFQSISGTSMSSPHVAGVFALIKQAHPDWSPAIAKSAIMTTAYQDVLKEDGATLADAFDMGAGHIDPAGMINKGSAFQPGLAYDAGLFEYAGFTCGADLDIFTPGSCVFLESIGVPFDAADLNLPSIGIADILGSQTIQRTVTSVTNERGWRTFDVSIDAPPGFEVTVSPSTLRLKGGQSATYYVTVTNVGTPAGEWRHGSLTWSDETGLYDVYSPIAVSGALFGAPATVNGEGADGTASFDVSFGYTGSYAAAPHGLVAPVLRSDSIGGDPDQTYPSGDDTTVGVQKWAFPISGAAFVRWQLEIPGPDDIDLFLENSSGDIVAASTNGGTDEHIEIVLPANDTYTMVVHGWSIPNEPLPYTLYFWNVPLTSGGSLSVDSAPASAINGETATIDISWSGLAAATDYLGAVSHTGDAGLMGLTLVEVSSP